MFSSVRCGLDAALALKLAAVMVLPVDHPGVRPVTVASLGNVMLQALAACRPGCDRGHPIALSPALARAVMADRAAENLSEPIRRNARMVGYLDVNDRGVVVNRNTPRG
jgi:CTP:molybdopterin cytidylyltransferase MocA